MFMSVIGLALILVLLPSEKARSGQLDLRPGVRINAVIELNKISGIYQYSYSVSSPGTDSGEIWTMDVVAPEDSDSVGKAGIADGRRFLEEGMLPGGALGGFKILSRDLPGVRTIYVRPKFKAKPVKDVMRAGLERVAAFKDPDVLSIQSIGPTSAPAEFVALDFLSYISRLQEKSEELGWITSIGVGSSLDGKLNNVRKKLQFGNTKAAANILNAFINEVDAQGCATYDDCPKGRHLSPEAWALLKFNAEYLLRRL